MSVTNELNTVKQLVLHVLKNHPETRDSDNLLYLHCCEYLGAKTINDLKKLNLSIISVHKIRQVIQNKEGLYKPSEDVKEIREQRRIEIKDYMSRLKKHKN